jgi:hypothetical protein
MMSQDQKWEKVREQVKSKQRRFGKLFLSEDGKELLDYLVAEWYHGDLLASTPEGTAKNLGARDVVKFLMTLRDSAKPENK